MIDTDTVSLKKQIIILRLYYILFRFNLRNINKGYFTSKGMNGPGQNVHDVADLTNTYDIKKHLLFSANNILG